MPFGENMSFILPQIHVLLIVLFFVVHILTDANICRADIPFFYVQILTQMYVVWLLFFFYVDKVSVEASKWETVNQRVTDLSGELKSIRSRINAL